MNTILLLHILTTVMFSGLVFRRFSSMNHALSAALFALMFPIGGIILYASFCYLHPKQHLHLEKLTDKGWVATHPTASINVDAEINVVPIEESLLVADKSHRRETILNLLKKNADDYIGYLLLALKNEDPETTHYAASSILHLQRNLDTQMMQRTLAYQQHPGDPVVIQAYFDILEQYTKTCELDPVLHQKYQLEAISLLKQLIARSKNVTLTHYYRLIELLMDTGNLEEAKHYCLYVDHFFEDTEDKFMHLLNDSFMMNDKDAFDATRKRLMTLPVPLSNQTNRLLHFWESQEQQPASSRDNRRLH